MNRVAKKKKIYAVINTLRAGLTVLIAELKLEIDAFAIMIWFDWLII